MSTYCFILGNHPLISIAEIWNRYNEPLFEFNHEDFALFDLKTEIDQLELDQLGGSIKVAKILTKVKRQDLIDELALILEGYHTGSKLDYGLSVYGFSEKELRQILLNLKKNLRSKEMSSRFINHQFKNISAAQYKSIKQKGIELLIIKKGSQFLLGEVTGVQDIDAYSKRDFDKPFRDMKMGMMPPKMAQILINLTGVRGKIYDPFCGSGTLVMEGILMGHEMMGSDINEKHVEGSYVNLTWLKKEFGIRARAELFEQDATQALECKIQDLGFEAIAFEGDLGLPHNQNINSDLLNKIIVQLTKLYIQFFNQLKQSKFKGPIVCALPFFRLKNRGDLMMDRLVEKVVRMGFKRVKLIADSVDTEDPYLLKYSRSGQAVGRAIYKFV